MVIVFCFAAGLIFLGLALLWDEYAPGGNWGRFIFTLMFAWAVACSFLLLHR